MEGLILHKVYRFCVICSKGADIQESFQFSVFNKIGPVKPDIALDGSFSSVGRTLLLGAWVTCFVHNSAWLTGRSDL